MKVMYFNSGALVTETTSKVEVSTVPGKIIFYNGREYIIVPLSEVYVIADNDYAKG